MQELRPQVDGLACRSARWVSPSRRQTPLPGPSSLQAKVEPCRFLRKIGRDPSEIPRTERRGMTGVQDVRSLGERLCAGKPVDPPYITIKTKECLYGRMDGRHRLIAACRMGLPEVPLEVLFKREKTGPFITLAPDKAKALFKKCLR